MDKQEQEYISIIKTKVDGKDAINLSFYGDTATLSNMLLSAMKNHPFIALSMIHAVQSYANPFNDIQEDKSLLN